MRLRCSGWGGLCKLEQPHLVVAGVWYSLISHTTLVTLLLLIHIVTSAVEHLKRRVAVCERSRLYTRCGL